MIVVESEKLSIDMETRFQEAPKTRQIITKNQTTIAIAEKWQNNKKYQT